MTKYSAMRLESLIWVPWWIKKDWFYWNEIVDVRVVNVERHKKAYAIDLEVVYDVNGEKLTFEETKFAPMGAIKNIPWRWKEWKRIIF